MNAAADEIDHAVRAGRVSDLLLGGGDARCRVSGGGDGTVRLNAGARVLVPGNVDVHHEIGVKIAAADEQAG